MAINITLNHIQLVKESTKRYDLPRLIKNPKDASEVGKAVFNLDNEAQEVVVLLSLNIHHRLVGVHEICRGSATKAIVHPREVFKTAFLHNAAAIILLHNHPSGNLSASQEDKMITDVIRESGNILDVPLLDHIINSEEGYLSFKEQGML